MPTVKSRQTFSGTMVVGNDYVPITINSVVVANTYVVMQTADGNDIESVTYIRQYLASSTLLELARSAIGQDVNYRIQVIEFESGVTVQRGHTPLDQTTKDITIDTVDRTKTFSECRLTGSGITSIDLALTRNLIVADDILRFGSPVADYDRLATWQVVEIDDALVAHYDSSVTNSPNYKNFTISSVDMGKTFLQASFGLIDTGITEDKIKYARLTAATNINLWAYVGAAMYYQIYTITIPNCEVQRAIGSILDTSDTDLETITEVNRDNSFIQVAGQCGDFCPTNSVDSWHGDYAIMAEFETEVPTLIRLRKGDIYAASLISWEVIEFIARRIFNIN